MKSFLYFTEQFWNYSKTGYLLNLLHTPYFNTYDFIHKWIQFQALFTNRQKQNMTSTNFFMYQVALSTT